MFVCIYGCNIYIYMFVCVNIYKIQFFFEILKKAEKLPLES
jgi:hypothetical protein